MADGTNFEERFKKFEDRFFLLTGSYQLQDEDGEPGDWIARVYVQTKTTGPSDPLKPVYPHGFRRFKTEAEANAVALWGGLQWLEEGCPSEADR